MEAECGCGNSHRWLDVQDSDDNIRRPEWISKEDLICKVMFNWEDTKQYATVTQAVELETTVKQKMLEIPNWLGMICFLMLNIYQQTSWNASIQVQLMTSEPPKYEILLRGNSGADKFNKQFGKCVFSQTLVNMQ